jgi:16S rRNA C967 or C1407 C5-methylase (RsmB/RsmF family)
VARITKAEGETAFREHYAVLFGERWPALEAALAEEADSVAFTAGPGGGTPPGETPPYFMDSASIFAASCLELPEGGRVLDACAAPGGKTLVLASRLRPGSSLVANELSPDRRRRLRAVLERHLEGGLRARVTDTGRDAASLCRSMPEAFDAILLDAPCSSERHVLADPRALAEWKPSRIRGLAMRQWALLSSALIMLKKGGCLVYSTCALSPDENDRVVERAAARYGPGLAFDRPAYPGSGASGEAEETEFGIMILPDRAGGAGPMYVCRMRKL